MIDRIAKLILAELLAFGALVFGGLGLLGGAVTWTGDSQLPLGLSWTLVVLFSILGAVLGKAAALRLRHAFQRRNRSSADGNAPAGATPQPTMPGTVNWSLPLGASDE